MQNYQSLPLEKLYLFHSMELFWKYRRKGPCGRGPVFTGITLSAEMIVEMLSCFAEFPCQPIQQLQHYIII